MGRTPMIAGNWKMYKTPGEAVALVQAIDDLLGDSPDVTSAVEAVVCPPFVDLKPVATAIEFDHGRSSWQRRTCTGRRRARSPARCPCPCSPTSGATTASSATRSVARCSARPTRPSTRRSRRCSRAGSSRSCAAGDARHPGCGRYRALRARPDSRGPRGTDRRGGRRHRDRLRAHLGHRHRSHSHARGRQRRLPVDSRHGGRALRPARRDSDSRPLRRLGQAGEHRAVHAGARHRRGTRRRSCAGRQLVLLDALDGEGLRLSDEESPRAARHHGRLRRSRGRGGNAIEAANTPNLDRLFSACPTTQLCASGLAVGLPEGQMGNSEVGHLNMGAGRVVYQELTRINLAVKDRRSSTTPCSPRRSMRAVAAGRAVHFMGLLSDGGVHSHQEHLYALLEMAKARGASEVYVHAFLDGRDVPPQSGLGFVERLEGVLGELGTGRIATVMGRYYAMDRDNRWDRVEKAWRAITMGDGVPAASAAAAVALVVRRRSQRRVRGPGGYRSRRPSATATR